VLAARAEIPAHRERLDRIVAGDLRAALGVGLAVAVVMVGFNDRPIDAGLARATPLLVAIAGASVYLSSLFDWYIIVPRMSGMLGARPCRREPAYHPRWPKSWRETTRWWYVHRIVAALVLRFGLAYALTLTVEKYLSLPGGATIVTAASLGAFAAYVAAVPRAVLQAGHPTMIVGHTIRRVEGTRVPRRIGWRSHSFALPLRKRVDTSRSGPREYVYDVALEGVELVRASERESHVPRSDGGTIDYEREPIKIPLKSVDDCEPADTPFRGCENHCSGINWYCIENPRCFEPK
jgi:hypothetical protein